MQTTAAELVDLATSGDMTAFTASLESCQNKRVLHQTLADLIKADKSSLHDFARLVLKHPCINADIPVNLPLPGSQTTLIMYACVFKPIEWVKMLLEFHPDLNITGMDGMNALHLCATVGDQAAVISAKAILASGLPVDLEHRNANNLTALELACLPGRQGRARIAAALIHAGAQYDPIQLRQQIASDAFLDTTVSMAIASKEAQAMDASTSHVARARSGSMRI
jgi:hypothetical protein